MPRTTHEASRTYQSHIFSAGQKKLYKGAFGAVYLVLQKHFFTMAQVTTWDFTFHIPDNKRENADIKGTCAALQEHTAKWCFQLEQGADSKRLHYQGRLRLRKRLRLPGLKALFELVLPGAHWSPTANANSGNFNYVLKADTRLEGPWQDNSPAPQEKTDDVYTIEEEGLYQWQATVLQSCENQRDRKTREPRKINIIVDKRGNTGKSTFVAYMMYHQKAFRMPPINNYKELMGFAIDFKSHAYLIDIPRAIPKGKLAELFAGIESLKDGQLYDTRYKGRYETRERPAVWVFSNIIPEDKWLSADRWAYWRIDAEYKLVGLNDEDDDEDEPLRRPTPPPSPELIDLSQ